MFITEDHEWYNPILSAWYFSCLLQKIMSGIIQFLVLGIFMFITEDHERYNPILSAWYFHVYYRRS